MKFSEKYTYNHSQSYFHKHCTGVRRRLTTLREIALARKALSIAGNPKTILDLPCGAGRFWKMLCENPNRSLLAADNSEDMITVAKTMQHPDITKKFKTFKTSVFDISLADNSVDHILCLRLFHHFTTPKDRIAALKELARVTKNSITISLWVDGNWQGNRKMAKKPKGKNGYTNRIVIPQTIIEKEIVQAGFKIKKHLDLLPGISMWRYYILTL